MLSKIEIHIIDYVRKLRIENNVSQENLGEILGVDTSFISQIEQTQRKKYNINHLNKIALYFKCSPKDFLPEKPYE